MPGPWSLIAIGRWARLLAGPAIGGCRRQRQRPSTRTVVPCAAIFDRVVDQVDEQLMQLIVIAQRRRAGSRGTSTAKLTPPCSAVARILSTA